MTMTRVDFYILPESTADARLQFACRLLHKAVKLGHQCYIHCDNPQQAQTIDQLLWQFQPTSFLPHKLLGEAGAPCTIEIGCGDDPGPHNDVLINVSSAIPDFFSRFQRVSEIASQDPNTLDNLRNNYRFYQQRNYPFHRHDMRHPTRR